MRANTITLTMPRGHFTLLFAAVLLIVSSSVASAQNVNTNVNTNANTNANTNTNTNTNANTNKNANGNTNTGSGRTLPPCPSPDAYAQVTVTRAFKKTSQGEELGKAKLGDEITLALEPQHINILLQKAKCENPNKKIVLFLDGRPVKDVTSFPPTDPSKPFLIFPLKRTENSKETWTHLLGESKEKTRSTPVSVGLEDEYPVTSTATIDLEIIPQGWFIFWLFVFAAILIVFMLLAVKSDVLRDVGPQPAEAGARKPYSLARTQAAWWFFLILAAYLFIGMITGDFSTTITGTVLGLLGISAGTVVGSAFVDAGKDSKPKDTTTSPTSPPAALVSAEPEAKNEYWWQDILSDKNGVSFHRFQMAALTLVLGIIFGIQVYKFLAMPDFSGSLLALLGISAGTYLGLKIPEPTTPKK